MPHSLVPGGSGIYLALVLVALLGTLFWWGRRFRADPRLGQIFAGAVVGAFLGAKLGYLVAEGWMQWGQPDFWSGLARGKTILGALLGGYLGVELIKRLVGYREATGDSFAAIVPIGIIVGRLGCLAHGCCQGVIFEGGKAWGAIGITEGSCWPAPLAEIAFNLMALLVFYGLRKAGRLSGQHFHLYLIGYGIFRFFHEFVRATPKYDHGLSGYQFLAIGVILLGGIGFEIRRKQSLTEK